MAPVFMPVLPRLVLYSHSTAMHRDTLSTSASCPALLVPLRSRRENCLLENRWQIMPGDKRTRPTCSSTLLTTGYVPGALQLATATVRTSQVGLPVLFAILPGFLGHIGDRLRLDSIGRSSLLLGCCIAVARGPQRRRHVQGWVPRQD